MRSRTTVRPKLYNSPKLISRMIPHPTGARRAPLCRSIAALTLFAALASSTQAAIETVVAGSDGVWTTNANWSDNSALPTGATVDNMRLNVNGLIDYDFPGVTTTISTGTEGRPLGIASGIDTNGTLRVSGGTLIFTTKAGLGVDQGVFITAAGSGASVATGVLHINGGDMIVNGPTSFLSVNARGGTNSAGAHSSGRITIDSGSLTVDRIDFGSFGNSNTSAGANGTVTLNGGLLKVRSIHSDNTTMQVNVNLNGGAIATAGAVLPGVDLLGGNIDNAKLNGAVSFDTSLGDGRISALLNGAGSLNKIGAGTLTIASAVSYTGATTITAGTLATTSAQTGTSGVTVADGAAFSVTRHAAGASFTTPSLSLGSATGAALSLSYSSFGLSPTAAIVNAGTFSVAAGSQIQLSGSGFFSGTFALIDYSGAIGGAGFAGLTLSVPNSPRATGTLVDNTADSRVDVNIVNQAIKWTGVNSADWDIDDSATGGIEGTQNWVTETTALAANYLQGANGNDSVVFDDSATGSRTINLTTALNPLSVVVNNTTASGDYTFAGAGSIGGAANLIKNGSGVLFLRNTGVNSYSGGTIVNAGALQVGDGATPGTGGLGNGPVTINGGTLEVNRPDGLTFSGGLLGAGGTLALVAGDATLNHATTNFTGSVNIGSGRTLRVTNSGTLGGPLAGNGNLDINPANSLTFILGGNSTFSGTTNVSLNSHLRITNSGALGDAGGGTTVVGATAGQESDVNGGSLQLAGNITVANEPLTISGSGGFASGIAAQQRGALQSISGNNTWAGPITIGITNTRIGVQDGASLTLSGPIIGGTNAVIFRGGTGAAGVITVSGAGNQWGDTKIYGNGVRLGIENGLSVTGVLYLGTSNVGESVLDLNGYNQQVAGLTETLGTGTGLITNRGTADVTFTISGELDHSYAGRFADGAQHKVSVVKLGPSTQTFTAASTHTGQTRVTGGTLVVNASISGSHFIVDGGTLRGTGQLGALDVSSGGVFAPGAANAIGAMSSGSFTITEGGTLSVDINTATLGADLHTVTGDLSIEIATAPLLTVTDLGTDVALAFGTTFPILNYSGAWNGGFFQVGGVTIADETGVFTLGSNSFTIDYDRGGNTVALVAVPEPSALAALLLGAGMLHARRRRGR